MLDIQGHRGARGLLPENTIAGFIRALELGVSTLEMDIVITADEQVVVSHEPWMSAQYCTHADGRPVSADEERSLRIFGMAYEDVRSFDCGSRGHPNFPRQEAVPAVKPLLRDVIRAAEVYRTEQGVDGFQYSIETKSAPEGDGELHPGPETFTRLLHSVLKEADVIDRSIIQSFDVRTLQVARRIDEAWRTSLLIEGEENAGVDEHLHRLGFTPVIFSPEHVLVGRALLEAAHEKGMQVIPWTVNDAERMRQLADLGVDGIITDYPDIAVAELSPRT